MTPAPDFRALCAELSSVVYEYCVLHEGLDHLQPLVTRANAALATPPLEPTDDELIEIARELRKTAGYLQLGCGWDRALRAIESAANLIEADLFRRLALPPKLPTKKDLREMFDENDWNYISPETFEDIVRTVLQEWGAK